MANDVTVQKFKTSMTCNVFASCTAGVVGKLLAGNTFYGVVLIPASTTFLGLATAVGGALVISKLVQLALSEFTEKAPFETTALYLGLFYYGTKEVAILTGAHPLGFAALFILGSAIENVLLNT